MNTIQSIEQAFNIARSQRRAALMPYFTIGFPDLPTSFKIIQSIAEAGADLIELGIPFSDPLADGPIIQHSTQAAIQNNVTLKSCLHLLHQLRESGLTIPLLLMSYYNPIFSYGEERFVRFAYESGAQGVIIPDLPPEEADEMSCICDQVGLAMIHLVAPTTPPDRIRFIAERSRGFLYVVSVTGLTGIRQNLPPQLLDFIQHVRSLVSLPLAVGFGISTPEQATTLSQWVDGVIVGSALIDTVRRSEQPIQSAGNFVRGLRMAMENIRSG